MHLYKYFKIKRDLAKYFACLFYTNHDIDGNERLYCLMYIRSERAYEVKVCHSVNEISSGNFEYVRFAVKFAAVKSGNYQILALAKVLLVDPEKIMVVRKSFSDLDNFVTYYNQSGFTTDEDKKEKEEEECLR